MCFCQFSTLTISCSIIASSLLSLCVCTLDVGLTFVTSFTFWAIWCIPAAALEARLIDFSILFGPMPLTISLLTPLQISCAISHAVFLPAPPLYAFAYAIKQTPYAFVSKIILCMYLLYVKGLTYCIDIVTTCVSPTTLQSINSH